MSEEQNYNPELESARATADAMGVPYTANQKASTIMKAVAKKRAELEAAESGEEIQESEDTVEETETTEVVNYSDDTIFVIPETGRIDVTKLKRNTKKYGRTGLHPKVREALRKEATELVRVKITCMNPAKKDWKGEIISVQNAVIGVVRKFVPYNNEAGDAYHVPRVLLDLLRERKYQAFTKVMIKGVETKRSRMVGEFAIEELPQISEAEFKAIQKKQLLESDEE